MNYASTEFFVGSAVLRSETVTMANKEDCSGVASFGFWEALTTYLSIFGVLTSKPCFFREVLHTAKSGALVWPLLQSAIESLNAIRLTHQFIPNES